LKEECTPMKKLPFVTVVVAALLMAGLPAAADHPTGATARDIQRLQDDLQNLDDDIAALEPSHPRYRELSDRATDVREDVTWLKVQLRRHRRDNREGLGASTAEVDEIRRQIATLQDDLQVSTNRRYTGANAQLPAGTEMVVRLDQPLSSRSARPEDRVQTSLVTPVRLDNRIVIPAGTRVRGVVLAAEPAQRPVRGGKLELSLNTLWLDDSNRLDLQTRVLSVSENIDKSETGRQAGYGALLGTVLGTIVGGRKGALLGLVIGGAGGAISSRGEDVELPEGTILTLALDRPLTVRPTFARR
jgi:hypothetical protein